MDTLFWFLIGLHVVLCFVLILLVMVQNDKGGGISGAFGGGGGSYGGAGAATFVQKLTTKVAFGFMVIVLGIDVIVAVKDNGTDGSALKAKVVETNESKGLGSIIPESVQPVVIDTAKAK